MRADAYDGRGAGRESTGLSAARSYVGQVAERLAALVEPVGVYLTGSAVLGGWTAGGSDIDMIAIVGAELPDAVKTRLVAAVNHRALPCPARGLESVVYRHEVVAAPSSPLRFELNLNTGERMTERITFDAADDPAHWFVLDLAIARRHARPLLGPPAGDLIGPVPEDDARAALADSLRWHEEHEPTRSGGILNACRAWRYAAERAWCSKDAAAAPGDRAGVVLQGRSRRLADTSLTISAAILETLGPIPPRRRWALVGRADLVDVGR